MSHIIQAVIWYLSQFYLGDPLKYVTFQEMYAYLYQAYLQSFSYTLSEGMLISVLDYLRKLGLIEYDDPYYYQYRLTAQGMVYAENPPQDYGALSLEAAQKNNEIATESNEIAKKSNQISYWALAIAILSLIVSLLRNKP